MAAYSRLNDAERERFEMLAEEAAEVVQAVTKILRHGKVTTDHCEKPPKLRNNLGDLERELGQLYAIARHMMELRDINLHRVEVVADMAWENKLKYTHHQQ